MSYLPCCQVVVCGCLWTLLLTLSWACPQTWYNGFIAENERKPYTMNGIDTHEMARMFLRENLKRLRLANNLSTAETAEIIGKSRQGYINYESGVRDIGIFDLVTLADYYNVSLDEIVHGPFHRNGDCALSFRTYQMIDGQLQLLEHPLTASNVHDDIVVVQHDDLHLDFFWKTQMHHKNHVMLFDYYDKPYVSKIYFNPDRSGFFLIGDEHITFNRAQSENLVIKAIFAGTLTKEFPIQNYF